VRGENSYGKSFKSSDRLAREVAQLKTKKADE
jgi:hypothetical protein